MHAKPYPTPLGPGVVARAEVARSAHTWLPDIEAYLAERELPTTLALTVADLLDYPWHTSPIAGLMGDGPSLEGIVDALDQLLRSA